MSYQQISIFDYDYHTRSLDSVRSSLEALKLEEVLRVASLEVTRNERFYTICKGNEFEEYFNDIDEAYRFINHLGG